MNKCPTARIAYWGWDWHPAELRGRNWGWAEAEARRETPSQDVRALKPLHLVPCRYQWNPLPQRLSHPHPHSRSSKLPNGCSLILFILFFIFFQVKLEHSLSSRHQLILRNYYCQYYTHKRCHTTAIRQIESKLLSRYIAYILHSLLQWILFWR